jgi:predicted dehydrogenase
MSSKVKVGVIGAGIGYYHAKSYKAVKDVELSAIADIDEARARKVANELGIPNVYTDYKEMLKKEKPDAVSVGLPNYLHKKVTIDAIKAGANVLCEKPMAMNAQEAEEMVEEAAKSKKILMIGFCHRFRADSKLLKEIINKGHLGEIYHAQAFALRRRGIPGLGGWFTTKSKSGGGGMIDIGVHILDLTMWEMGFPKPVSVSGAAYMKFGHKKDYTYVSMWGNKVEGGTYDVDDFACGFIRFDNDATISLEVSWAANLNNEGFYSIILGDKAGAKLDAYEDLKIYTEQYGKIVDIFPKYAKEDNWINQISHFVDCVKNNKKPISPGEHGLVVQKVLDAIYLSSETKKEVKIK